MRKVFRLINRLSSKLITYKFICYLTLWRYVLDKIDKVSIALQQKDITLSTASILLKSLKEDLLKFRLTEFENIYEKAKEICDKMNISPEFIAKRKIKIKKLFSYEAEDEGNRFSEKEKFKTSFLEVLDSIYNQIETRFENLQVINEDFNFLTGHSITNKSDDDLKKNILKILMAMNYI
ncbi:unnamed protein product [Ceutorhynchus assimilis]|uniref:Uncharacterized protein n=1 Tax=Ceutorhynchus assimilis TaxID=467358 RepID=A0A9N9MHB5_9CUCU|nr:unnamed protein product [Ceutorhynchus assimilis]